MSRKAVVIGIDEYPGQMRLHGCVRDAETFHKLIAFNGDDSRNFEAGIERNVPTKHELTEKVYDLFKGDEDIALLYFSGHGTTNQLDTYLVTPDFRKFDPGLSLSHLLSMANTSRCRNKIIILDCCHSGAAGIAPVTGSSLSMLGQGVTILSASKENENALESGTGVFTGLLIQALSGGAADIRGNITPGSIYAYIDQALGVFDQRPVFKTNISAFTSLRKVDARISDSILKNLTRYFPDPTQEKPLNPSFEYTNDPDEKPLLLKPYADPELVPVFKELQKMVGVGLVEPVGSPYMYWAAMESRSCRLTPLGQHYWRLVHKYKNF